MKLLAFIIPFFGVLPRELEYFLLSVSYNPNYNWIIFTNDKTKFVFPDNVKVIYCSFEHIKKLIQSRFDFPISLNHPKKLCDFKPAYGYIFEEYLRDYKYWGYCDLDQYFGDLSHWLTEEYLNQFDRVFSLGHMTIYRNTDSLKKLFMCEDIRKDIKVRSYKTVFSNENNYVFDEIPRNQININDIALQQKIRQSYDWFATDILPFKSNFSESFCDIQKKIWSESSQSTNIIVFWENGHIFLLEKDKQRIKRREVLYVHIQKRKLHTRRNNGVINSFVILPNKIIPLDSLLSTKKLNWFFFRNRIRKIMHVDELKWKMKQVNNIISNKLIR